jgi:hypothetical protein
MYFIKPSMGDWGVIYQLRRGFTPVGVWFINWAWFVGVVRSLRESTRVLLLAQVHETKQPLSLCPKAVDQP